MAKVKDKTPILECLVNKPPHIHDSTTDVAAVDIVKLMVFIQPVLFGIIHDKQDVRRDSLPVVSDHVKRRKDWRILSQFTLIWTQVVSDYLV